MREEKPVRWYLQQKSNLVDDWINAFDKSYIDGFNRQIRWCFTKEALMEQRTFSSRVSRDLIKSVYSKFPLPWIFPCHILHYNFWQWITCNRSKIMVKEVYVYANFGWLSRISYTQFYAHFLQIARHFIHFYNSYPVYQGHDASWHLHTSSHIFTERWYSACDNVYVIYKLSNKLGCSNRRCNRSP